MVSALEEVKRTEACECSGRGCSESGAGRGWPQMVPAQNGALTPPGEAQVRQCLTIGMTALCLSFLGYKTGILVSSTLEGCYEL